MKEIKVVFENGLIKSLDDNNGYYGQEDKALKINADITVEDDKYVRAYIKAPNDNSTVTDKITAEDGIYSVVIDGEYMEKGTLYVGFEVYDDEGYAERFQPLKVYIDAFVSLNNNSGGNVYVVTVDVGTVTTLEPDDVATVENVGTKKDMILNFGIPRNQKVELDEELEILEPGEEPYVENVNEGKDITLKFGIPRNQSIEIEPVITLEPGESAVVENIGDKKDMKLQFSIPRGEQGIQGPQGEKGEQGIQGIQGEKGDKGDKGDTPQKGIDYFTPEDIAGLGIENKVDKVKGKGLSTNDFTDELKEKLENMGETIIINCHPSEIKDYDTLCESLFSCDYGVHQLKYIDNGDCEVETIMVVRPYSIDDEYYYETCTYLDIEENKWYEVEIELDTQSISKHWYCKGDFIPDLSSIIPTIEITCHPSEIKDWETFAAQFGRDLAWSGTSGVYKLRYIDYTDTVDTVMFVNLLQADSWDAELYILMANGKWYKISWNLDGDVLSYSGYTWDFDKKVDKVKGKGLSTNDFTNELKEKLENTAGAIINSASGEIIQISDSADERLKSLYIYGKTKQITTTGKNLFNYRTFTNSVYPPTINDDGSLDYNGTYSIKADISHLESGKTYVFNWKYTFDGELVTSNMATYKFYYDDGTYVAAYYGNAVITDANKKLSYIDAFFKSGYSEVFSAKAWDIQITEGTAVQEYEPYSGGFASPSPDWSQPFESVGDKGNVGLTEKNNNWFPILPEITVCGVTLSKVDDYYVLNGTASDSGLFVNEIYLPNGTYTLSANNPQHNNIDSALVQVYSPTTKKDLNVRDYSLYGIKTLELTEANDYSCRIRIQKGITYNNFIVKPQLELGTVATEYKPPITKLVSITTPNGLRGIPVTSGGNYTDSNGQQWACDEVDFERGVYVQRINKYNLTGNEGWVISTVQADLKEGFTRFECATAAPQTSLSNSLWSHFQYKGVQPKDGFGAWVAKGYNGKTGLRIVADLTTVDELKAWLQNKATNGEPVTVQYILETPNETPLTSEQIAAYKALQAYKPNTVITNDENAYMKVDYVADTKTYIDNKFAELQNAILSTGGNV